MPESAARGRISGRRVGARDLARAIEECPPGAPAAGGAAWRTTTPTQPPRRARSRRGRSSTCGKLVDLALLSFPQAELRPPRPLSLFRDQHPRAAADGRVATFDF